MVKDIISEISKDKNISSKIARSNLLHFDYKCRKVTAVNIVFPYSLNDFSVDEVYTFNIYHTVEVDYPCELHRLSLLKLEIKNE